MKFLEPSDHPFDFRTLLLKTKKPLSLKIKRLSPISLWHPLCIASGRRL
ncbi:MAG: hypothetical protein Q7T11_07520 [Deltaproteobacteria bacterium]|nr:hypothetical protein [Deltaproteobacteria bacterium]